MTVQQNNINCDLPDSGNTVLESSRVLLLDSTSKNDALLSLIKCMEGCSVIEDIKELEDGIFHREELMSTGIGYGIAVPHVRLKSVESPVMSVGICKNPLNDYESLDDKPVNLIFMIAAGIDQHSAYLELLSSISTMVKDSSVRESILQAEDSDEVCKIISDHI